MDKMGAYMLAHSQALNIDNQEYLTLIDVKNIIDRIYDDFQDQSDILDEFFQTFNLN